MTFPTKQGEWELTDAEIGHLNNQYLRLDLYGELRKACAWLEANPSRRKTQRGMKRFIVGWLNGASADTAEQIVLRKLSYRPMERDRSCPHQPPCASPGNWQCQQRTVLEQARAQR